MIQQYASSCEFVNVLSCLIVNKRGCSLFGMTLGERLQKAREYAGLTQQQLSDKSRVAQQNISKIEKNKQKKSADLVNLAVACGVRAEWLALEQGDMVDGVYVDDPRLKAVLNDPKKVNAMLLMEPLPGYAIDHVIKEIVETQKLIDQAGQGESAAA